MTNTSSRTVLLFWEGADWALLRPLLDRGLLPVLKQLLERGSIADTISLAPFEPTSLFASAVTGQRLWRHGVTGPSSGECPVLKAPALWDIPGYNSQDTICVGGPVIQQKAGFPGIAVSERFFQAGGDVIPAALAEELMALRVGIQDLDPGIIRLLCPQLSAATAAEDPMARRLAEHVAELYSINNVAVSLMETEPWKLAVVYIPFLEKIRRGFEKYQKGASTAVPGYLPERYGEVLEGACRLQDMLWGEILRIAGENTQVFLLSTRGGPVLSAAGAAAYPVQNPGSGIFVAAGAGIRGKNTIGTVSLLDVAPTLLHGMGLPVAEDQDGRVLTECFINPESLPQIESCSDRTSQHKGGYTAGIIPLPADPGECFGVGVDLYEANRYVEALPLLERALLHYPESRQYAFWLACCQARLGLTDMADETAEVLRDHGHGALLQQVLLARMMARPDKVLALLANSGTPEELPPIAANCYALALQETDRWEEAFEFLSKELLKRPSNEVWLGIAHCYMHNEQYGDAEKASRFVIANNPRLARAHLSLAYALEKQKRHEEAWETLTEAHRLAAGWAEVRSAVKKLYPARVDELLWPELPVAKDTAALRKETLRRKGEWNANRVRSECLSHKADEYDRALTYRAAEAYEFERVAQMLRVSSISADDWRLRVWEVPGPVRLSGAAAWRLVEEGKTAHLFLRVMPRYLSSTHGGVMLRPLMEEIGSAGATEIITTFLEEQPWRKLLSALYTGAVFWQDEDWSGNAEILRLKLARYDTVIAKAKKDGWKIRSLLPDDWSLVEEWGLKAGYFNVKQLERMRAHCRANLSGVVQSADGICGLLLATQNSRTAVLEFICGNPEQPHGWPLATAMLLRRLVSYEESTANFDTLVLTTNLNRGRSMHNLAQRLGMQCTRLHYHSKVTV